MSEHTVTENITQTGTTRTVQLLCSCGASTEAINLKKTSLRVVRKVFAELIHDPKTEKVRPKKSKKQKPVVESPDDKLVADIEDAADLGAELEQEKGDQIND